MEHLKSKFYFLAIFIVVALLVAEVVSKYILGLGCPPLYVTHEKIEYMLKPNQDIYRFGNRIFINNFGMRSMQFSKNRSENDYRIMIFGDSVINGGAQTDHKELATTIIQNRLNEVIDKKVIVGNISAGSWGPGNWLAFEREYGFFGADLIVLVISSHDYADNPTFEPLNPNLQPQNNPFSAFTEGVGRYLPRYLTSIFSSESSELDSFKEPQESEIVKGLKDLSLFISDAKKNTPNVIVIQHWEKSETEKGVPKPGNEIINRQCSLANVKVIQMYDIYRKVISKGINPYRDNIHLNKFGQNVLADEIIKNISFRQGKEAPDRFVPDKEQ